MKPRDSDRTNEDEDLFQQAVADVRPLNHNLAAPIPAPKAPARTASTETSNNASTEFTEFGEELRYLRPGIQTSSLQKLRRGQFPIESTLDLHGLTAAEATIQLKHFIQQSQTAGRHAVRIVHGKGYGSAGRQPVLKTKVYQLLQQFPCVLAFCSASPRDGGTGAVDVLLKKGV